MMPPSFPTNGTLDKIIKYGVGTVIALWLTWWLTVTQEKKLDDLTALARINNNSITSSQTEMMEFKSRNEHYLAQLVRLAVINCENNAKTVQQKDNCQAVVK